MSQTIQPLYKHNDHLQIILRISLLVCVVFFWGCQAKPLGSACKSSDECAQGLFCDTGTPAGYCTVVCSRALPCPGRSVCARINEDQEEIFRCLQPCGVNSDCQPNLVCQAIKSGDTKKVCFVQNSTP